MTGHRGIWLKGLVTCGKRWLLKLGRLVTDFNSISLLRNESKARNIMSMHVAAATFLEQINRCSWN
jgi:hypothetical protein